MREISAGIDNTRKTIRRHFSARSIFTIVHSFNYSWCCSSLYCDWAELISRCRKCPLSDNSSSKVSRLHKRRFDDDFVENFVSKICMYTFLLCLWMESVELLTVRIIYVEFFLKYQTNHLVNFDNSLHFFLYNQFNIGFICLLFYN